MNTPTITQTPLQLQLQYTGAAEVMTDLRRKIDGLARVVEASIDKGNDSE